MVCGIEAQLKQLYINYLTRILTFICYFTRVVCLFSKMSNKKKSSTKKASLIGVCEKSWNLSSKECN